MGGSQLDNNENRSYLSEGNEEEAGMLVPYIDFTKLFFQFCLIIYLLCVHIVLIFWKPPKTKGKPYSPIGNLHLNPLEYFLCNMYTC